MELPSDLGLTEPEELLRNALAAGCGISFGDGDPRESASPNEQEPEQRTIRGPVLAMLLKHVGAGSPLSTSEIHIRGARVVGAVDLSHAELPVLQFGQCLFENSLVLLSARVRKLHLDNCVLGSVEATGAVIEGFLLITQSKVLQGISLIDARVGQSVGISGTKVVGCGRPAVHADGLETSGGLVLGTFPNENGCADAGDIFHAIGEVRLLGARVGRDLDCSGGRFENTGGVALAADRADIRGEVRLASGFHATGEVRLWRTQIGSDVSCLGGRFENQRSCQPTHDGRDPGALKLGGPLGEPGDYALRADGAEINGSVNLAEGFSAKGVVYLTGVRIGSDLNCSGGKFDNPGGEALAADSAKIGGNARLDAGFCANGLVGLLGVRIDGQLSCSAGRFNSPEGRALGADGAEVKGNVNLSEGFHASGKVQFLSANLNGQLNCTRGTFENSNKTALTLQEATMNSLWLRELGSETAGRIVLTGSRADLLADDPEVSARRGVDLYLDGFAYGRFAPDAPQDVESRIQWVSRKPLGYRPQLFDQLATVYMKNGQEEQARDVLIAKRRKRRESLRGWPSRSWDYLQDWTVLYGWQPWRALVIGLVLLMIVFGLVTAAQAVGLVLGPSDVIASYHPFVHALDVFLPIIDLGLESRWAIDTATGGAFAWLVRVSLWALPVVGWVTITLALAALTGIVKRE